MSTSYAGLDWSSQTHAVCVIDEHGVVKESVEIPHDEAGLRLLAQRLRHWGSPAVAIERPSGLLVDSLVEAGFTVVPIHPNRASGGIQSRLCLRARCSSGTTPSPHTCRPRRHPAKRISLADLHRSCTASRQSWFMRGAREPISELAQLPSTLFNSHC